MPRKPTTRRKSQAGATAMAAHAPAVTVRHYCQGIGDCHLLSFKKPNGPPFRVLIDCGVHVSIKGGAALVGDIVADLKKETGGKIDVLDGVTGRHAGRSLRYGAVIGALRSRGPAWRSGGR